MLRLKKTLPPLAIVALCGALATWKVPQAASETRLDQTLPALVFVEAPKVVSGNLTGRFPQGSRLVRLAQTAPASSPANLTPDFFAVADPRVSGDSSKVLFSGQIKPGSAWQIWEMNADGSEKHQVTDCLGDCFQPAYLPRGEIVFTVVTGKMPHASSAIYVSKNTGAEAHAITFGPGNFQAETVLHDGRILVSANSPLVLEHGNGGNRALFVINPDGTGLSEFRREPFPNRVRTGAEELNDGTVIFVEREVLAHPGAGGELASITPGALHNSVITPLHAEFWSAHQLDGNTLVVAKPERLSPAANAKFNLYTFDLERKIVGRLVYRHPSYSSVQAVPLEPRPDPKYYWSILHPDSKTGRTICLNAYLSSDAQRERFAGHLARVRVLSLDEGQDKQQILGESPVESDGSFYLAAPADRPIRFELLDPGGKVIHAQQSWIWVRPGEDHACLGCHANPALTAPNHWALALKRASGPTSVGATPAH